MTDLDKRYEQELQRVIAAATRQALSVYEGAIIELAVLAAGTTAKGKPFSFSVYPLLEKQVEAKIRNMHKSLLRLITSAVKRSWALSNEKNDIYVDRRLKGRRMLPKNVRTIFYDPNAGALDAFLQRKASGLNLSDRVWNLLDPFKAQMEQTIGLEISQGTSAVKMATKMKQYLNEPDKLFRRVRGEDGKLRLSKRAKAYNPGQGVYRSSHKNAARLTRTETNVAYRSSDHERWKKMDFIIGIEIRTSNTHPEFDICDECKGKYPKDFKFTGWHPQCKCFAIPLQMTDEQYDKYEDFLLGNGDKPQVKGVEQPPAGFSKWVVDNEGRLQKWKNKPYWVKDNKQYI